MSDKTIDLVIFDKDGTLVDVDSTWVPALTALIIELANGDSTAIQKCADAIGVDIRQGHLVAGSPAVWASNAQLAELISASLPTSADGPELLVEVEEFLANAVPATVHALPDAEHALQQLQDKGIKLALATNDGEDSTRAQIEQLGWTEHFDWVGGYDSGWGAKPDPGMLSACLDRLRCPPDRAVMVGDSPSDMLAAQRAGIACVWCGNPDHPSSRTADHQLTNLRDIADLIDRLAQA